MMVDSLFFGGFHGHCEGIFSSKSKTKVHAVMATGERAGKSSTGVASSLYSGNGIIVWLMTHSQLTEPSRIGQ